MIGGHIRLGAAMRLDIRIGRVEKLLRPFYSESLDRVDVLASAVIAVSWIAFRVFRAEN